ncbi:MAG: FAD-dependent oxidoreductase [Polyangiaceae bacterium]|nr:FAD-dependent oxidoreductase [Polyangiaceae bacterium]
MSDLDADVIIVGAGMTGLHAAAELERLSPQAKVLVLEASSKPGGRVRTQRIVGANGAEHQADLGAHYIARRHQRLCALANRLAPGETYSNVENYGSDPACRARLGGRWSLAKRSTSFLDIQGLTRNCPPSDGVAIFRSLSLFLGLEKLVDVERPWDTPFARELDSITFQDWIVSQDLPLWVSQMWQIAAIGIISALAREVSLLWWVFYNASNRGLLNTSNDYEDSPQELSLAGGLGTLVERYAKTLRCEVRSDTPVRAIDHGNPAEVRVVTQGGETFRARHVVVAAAPHAVGRNIEFSPALGAARRAHFSQPAGHSVKAVLYYREPWWHDAHGGMHFASFMTAPGDVGIEWALDTSCPQRNEYSLVTFVSDRLIDAQPDGDEASIRRAVLEAAVELTGDERARDVSGFAFCDWRKERFIGGGPNTILGPGILSRLGGVLGEPEGPHDRLHFASAEQSVEFSGYVEGAMACAERTAERISAALSAERRGGSPREARVVHGPSPRGTDALQTLAFGAGYAAMTPAWLARPLLDRAWAAVRRITR